MREPEAPLGWGLLVEKEGALTLHRKPVWHDSRDTTRLRVLQKIAGAGTRQLNRRLEARSDSLRAEALKTPLLRAAKQPAELH